MKLARIGSILILLSLIFSACSAFTLPAEELTAVIANDLVVLDEDGVPPQVLAHFSDAEVLFIGENHNQVEHQELLASWVISLHAEGYRQLLLECYQLFDWIIADYVNGEVDALPRYLEVYYSGILDPLRAFNLTLPPEERISVHAVDINHDIDAYFTSLSEYAKTLPQADVIEMFLESVEIADPAAAADQVNEFYAELLLNEALYRAQWGDQGFTTVARMTWMQTETYPIKQIWNTRNNKAHRLREDVIKELVDSLLAESRGKTVINMGGNHAQRTAKRGTRQEWLGEYLVKRSPHAAGKTYLVYVMVYAGEHDDGNGNQTTFSLDETSPENELFRLMHARAGDAAAFLPLTDPLFASQRVAVNYRSVVRGFPPREAYDAFILLPEGHIIRWQP